MLQYHGRYQRYINALYAKRERLELGCQNWSILGGFTAVTLAWAIIDLPETTGRTFSEINELFNQGVPARKFASTVVDPFGKGKTQLIR